MLNVRCGSYADMKVQVWYESGHCGARILPGCELPLSGHSRHHQNV